MMQNRITLIQAIVWNNRKKNVLIGEISNECSRKLISICASLHETDNRRKFKLNSVPQFLNSPAQLNTMELESFKSYIIKWITMQVLMQLAICTLLEKLGIELNLLVTINSVSVRPPLSKFTLFNLTKISPL